MIYTKLSQIQQELKAPKNLWNKFGGFKYRSAESILEAFKPYEAKYGVCLFIQDSIEAIDGRFYIKAEATLVDTEDGSTVTTCAYARESDTKKGLDASQITGSTSSYARKYCLNGLFLLDDSKDPDTDEFHKQTHDGEESKQGVRAVSPEEFNSMVSLTKQKTILKNLCEKYKVDLNAWLEQRHLDWKTITAEDLANMTKTLQTRFNQSKVS